MDPGATRTTGRYVEIEVSTPASRPTEKGFSRRSRSSASRWSTPSPAKPYVLAQLGATGAAPPALPAGLGFYVKSGFLNTVPDALVTELIHACDHAPEWFKGIGIGTLGGATRTDQAGCHGILESPGAVGPADFRRLVRSLAGQRNAQDMRDLWKPFEPFTKGYYVNTEPSENEQRLRATYGDNYTRLVSSRTNTTRRICSA